MDSAISSGYLSPPFEIRIFLSKLANLGKFPGGTLLSVVIRLSRQGKRHSPFYRIAVADSRKAATGKFLQHIGFYDPKANPPVLKVDEESALKWLGVGAQPSDTVRALFAHQGLMDKFTKIRHGKQGSEVTAKATPWKPKKKLHKKKKEALAKEKEAAAKAAAAPAAEAPAA